MKVIFLDIDGVLNTARFIEEFIYENGHKKARDDYGSIFCPKAVENLRLLIEASGERTYIVVSSTWRASGLEIMKEMWKKRNLPGEVIDITVSFRNSDISVPRGLEIDHYLKEKGYWSYRDLIGEAQHGSSIENYIILDDDSDMLYNQKDNFVHLDPMIGLADKRKLKRAINILTRETKWSFHR